MPAERVNKRKEAEPASGAPDRQQSSPGLAPPESAVLGLQQTAGNAATTGVLGGTTTGPGPEVAQALRAAQTANDVGQIRGALNLLDGARSQLQAALGLLFAPETFGAWVGMSQSVLSMLQSADALLANAERMRQQSDAPAWVEGPEEARASSLLEQQLGELRAKLLQWQVRLPAVGPFDVGTPSLIMNEMMIATGLVHNALDMSQRAAASSRD